MWRRGLKGHQRAHLFAGGLPVCGNIRLLAEDTAYLTPEELTAHGQPSVGDVCALCLDKSAHASAP